MHEIQYEESSQEMVNSETPVPLDESPPDKLPLSLVVDFGASGTKALVTDGKTVKLLFMSPEVADVPSASIRMFEEDNFNSESDAPENRAWCGIGGTYRAVGFLALHRFRASTPLTIPKFELAFFKILCLFWVVSEKFQLPSSFSIDVSLLLPPSEYGDRFELERMLRDAVSEFDTPSGGLCVDLGAFECKPEGAGVLMYLQSLPKLRLNHRTATLVMIGYRNASLISVENGSVVNKVSSDFGMNYLIHVIQNYVSIYVPLSVLLSVIDGAGANINRGAQETEEEREEVFRVLSPMIGTSNLIAARDGQLERLRDVIANARDEYLNAVLSWMNPLVPFGNDLMIFCGGTANYLSPELRVFASQKGSEFVQDDFIRIPKRIDWIGLRSRLTDVYCYFCLVYNKKWKGSEKS